MAARLRAELPGALRGGQLVGYFQPEVELSTGRLVAAELLARWEHPEFGMLQPALFIPLVEELALMEELSRLMLRQALAQHRAWATAGWIIPVSVNIGPACVAGPAFPATVAQLLRDEQVPGQMLALEVSEETGTTAASTSVLRPAGRDRRPGLPGRLRHRLRLAGEPGRLAHRRAQARPVHRAAHGHATPASAPSSAPPSTWPTSSASGSWPRGSSPRPSAPSCGPWGATSARVSSSGGRWPPPPSPNGCATRPGVHRTGGLPATRRPARRPVRPVPGVWPRRQSSERPAPMRRAVAAALAAARWRPRWR